jgi:hypothetical protein
MDFIIYGDQLCFTHPSSLWTPDITDVATLLPTFNAFMDTGPIIAAAATQTSTIKFHYGVIDAVRRPPSVIAQSLLTLDHATKGRVRLLLANGENKQMKPYGIARKGANEKLSDSLRMVTSVQVLERLQPYLDLGVIDELSLVNYAELCGVKYMASAGEAIVKLLSKVKGIESATGPGVTTLVTEGLST